VLLRLLWNSIAGHEALHGAHRRRDRPSWLRFAAPSLAHCLTASNNVTNRAFHTAAFLRLANDILRSRIRRTVRPFSFFFQALHCVVRGYKTPNNAESRRKNTDV
jgi:hypothetical protein